MIIHQPAMNSAAALVQPSCSFTRAPAIPDHVRGSSITEHPATTAPMHCKSQAVDLWKIAFNNLRKQQGPLVQQYERILSDSRSDGTNDNPEEIIQSVIVSKREQLLRTQWNIRMGRCSIAVKSQIDRILKIIRAFKDVGSVAVQSDPLHAGLPWAGICLLLTVHLSASTFLPHWLTRYLAVHLRYGKLRSSA